MTIDLRCVPPSTTAQQKRQGRAGGRPVFFKSPEMEREEWTWAALLAPHVPASPMLGPVICHIRLVYPHLKGTKAALRDCLIPKDSSPDADNVCKALCDLMASLRFIDDDKQIADFRLRKFRGPEAAVGINIVLEPEQLLYQLVDGGLVPVLRP